MKTVGVDLQMMWPDLIKLNADMWRIMSLAEEWMAMCYRLPACGTTDQLHRHCCEIIVPKDSEEMTPLWASLGLCCMALIVLLLLLILHHPPPCSRCPHPPPVHPHYTLPSPSPIAQTGFPADQSPAAPTDSCMHNCTHKHVWTWVDP